MNISITHDSAHCVVLCSPRAAVGISAKIYSNLNFIWNIRLRRQNISAVYFQHFTKKQLKMTSFEGKFHFFFKLVVGVCQNYAFLSQADSQLPKIFSAVCLQVYTHKHLIKTCFEYLICFSVFHIQ